MRRQAHIAVIALVAGLAVSSARANGLSWTNLAGGSASTTTNWSPNQMPTAVDDLTFNLVGNYGVTFNSTVASALSHTYKKGGVTLTISSPHTVSGNILVGNVAGDNATMTLGSGTLSTGSLLSVGSNSGSTGVLNVTSTNSNLIVGTNLAVGDFGTGTLNVTNSGHVQVNGAFLPGINSTGVGNVTVSGFQVTPVANSLLTVTGNSRIGQVGDATMTVSNGAAATFAGRLTVGDLTGSNSSITLQTAGLLDARLSVGTDLYLGANVLAGFSGGTGTLNVNTGGSATVSGTLFVGSDPDGGTGVLNVNGGTVTSHDLIIHDTQGTFNFSDGQVTVDGGTFDPPGIAYTLNGTSNPLLLLASGASTTLSGISFGLRVGTTDSGHFFVNNSSVTVTSGSTILGDSAGSVGAFDAVHSTVQLGAMTLGNGGTGHLSISNGATFSSGTITLGAGANGSGDATNSNSQWTVTGNAFVGGTSGAATGSGLLRTELSGTTHITGNLTVWDGGGSVEVDNATLTVDGSVTHRGTGILTNGTMNVGSITLSNGTITGSGSVNGNISMTNGSSITANGALTLGNPASVNGFNSIGLLDVGGNTVTILDANLAILNNCTIANAGHLIAANGVQISAGTTLSGANCVVDADVSNLGSITTSGTGMRFGGVVTRLGSGTMSGPAGATFGFNSGGGYSGDGTIAAQVDFDAGSTCTASGILTMGNASSNFGVTMDGTLHCGSGTVTLLDANGVGLGTLTDLNGGNLVCAQNLTVNFGKTIEGTGFVQTPLLTINGAVKPADLPSQPPHRGTLNVSGAVTLGVNNNFFCDIDPGIEFATSDQIRSSGIATISGALTVAFIDGYVPQGNQSFDIVVGSSRVGTFTSTSFPPVGAFGPPHVEYFADRAKIVMCYANCDGSGVSPVLTANDFQCFLNKFAAADAYANCDGSTVAPILTANDFQCFLNKFAAGCN